ncbi:MAG: response regulator transcription factor [Actinomycetota bacterium]
MDAAEVDLASARDAFEQLGARLWADRARALLGGEPAGPSEPPLSEALTPGELRVALAVGRGATNKAAAEELFLSVKTVDFHLQGIYRKLGLHSRAELAARVAREGAAPG